MSWRVFSLDGSRLWARRGGGQSPVWSLSQAKEKRRKNWQAVLQQHCFQGLGENRHHSAYLKYICCQAAFIISKIFNALIVFVSISCQRKLCVTSRWPPSPSSTLSPTRSATPKMDRYVTVGSPLHLLHQRVGKEAASFISAFCLSSPIGWSLIQLRSVIGSH